MSSGRRPTSRPGAPPGRGKPRTRTQAPKSSLRTSTAENAGGADASRAPRRRSYILTARAIALSVVLLILTISYATSLRIYFSQAHEISTTKAEIAERQQRILQLQGDLARWDDEGYVRSQARERLGWVVPGETGFTVVDSEGRPLGGGAEIKAESASDEPAQDTWWSKLWGSVEAADRPAPVPDPAREKPITEKTKPNR
ncbi:MAG TPA: septum formation initiator family protein [Propionibacteriaceae bacterium]|nr:septum formation initiator family protein [Propionibacteriaceae bacterium]